MRTNRQSIKQHRILQHRLPWLIILFTEWSGINALLYYGPSLMLAIGLRGDTITLLGSGGIGIVQFIAVFPAIVFIDKWGTFQPTVVFSTVELPGTQNLWIYRPQTASKR